MFGERLGSLPKRQTPIVLPFSFSLGLLPSGKGKQMHYYQFNIGDYSSHTRHLSLIEDAIYRRLLDIYYLHERPLNSGLTSVARQINAKEYEPEVKNILEEFFELTDEGWIHSRADKEIAQYRAKIEQASRAGRASAERRFNERLTDVQPTNNHKPLTIKQKPITNKDTAALLPDCVSETDWQSFVAHRKAMRKPMTDQAKQLALKKLVDLNKNGYSPKLVIEQSIERGWAGLFEVTAQRQAVKNNLATSNQAAVMQWLEDQNHG